MAKQRSLQEEKLRDKMRLDQSVESYQRRYAQLTGNKAEPDAKDIRAK